MPARSCPVCARRSSAPPSPGAPASPPRLGAVQEELPSAGGCAALPAAGRQREQRARDRHRRAPPGRRRPDRRRPAVGWAISTRRGRATTGGSTSRNSAGPARASSGPSTAPSGSSSRPGKPRFSAASSPLARRRLRRDPSRVLARPATTFLDVLDDLDQRGLVPEEIYILELGVGTGQQAKICLDTLRELCAARGRDYFRRVDT